MRAPGRTLNIKDSRLKRKLTDIRGRAEIIWRKGLINHPDFTLHGIEHADFIVTTIGDVLREVDKQQNQWERLNDVERFLLGVSAYLHDIGMLIRLDNFIDEYIDNASPEKRNRWQNLDEEKKRKAVVMDYCRTKQVSVKERKDVAKLLREESKLLPRNLRDAELIRQIHHLLVQDSIAKHAKYLLISSANEYDYIGSICRGHRTTDLSGREYDKQSATVNNTKQDARIGALAALLRLADELDFTPGRAPEIHFEMYSRTLQEDPRSLRHWIKHSLTTRAEINIETEGGGKLVPVLKIRALCPSREYETFLFEPFFKKVEQGLKDQSLAQRLDEICLTQPKADFQYIPRTPTAVKDFPAPIQRAIQEKGLEGYFSWLEQERATRDLERVATPELPSQQDLKNLLGYERLETEVVYEWESKDKCKVICKYRVKPTKELRSIINLFDGEGPLSSCAGPQLSDKQVKFSYDLINRKKRRRYFLQFASALSSEYQYTIEETFKNLFLPKEEIDARMNEGKWPLDEALQFVAIATAVPTKRVLLKVHFPPNYRAMSPCHRVLALGNKGRLLKEEDECSFRHNKQQMELEREAPLPYARYCLCWFPENGVARQES